MCTIIFTFLNVDSLSEVGLTRGKILLVLLSLTFRGPCIVMYSYNESQRDALFLKFLVVKANEMHYQIYLRDSASRWLSL